MLLTVTLEDDVLLDVTVLLVVVVGRPPSKTTVLLAPGAPTTAVKGPYWLSQMPTPRPKKCAEAACDQVTFSWRPQGPKAIAP